MTTQAEVDAAFNELILPEWEEAVKESGKTEAMFIATDSTGFVADFMQQYQLTKEAVEAEGFTFPTLIKGLTINVSETDED